MSAEQQSPFDSEMSELFESFVIETNEILETLGQNLVELERRPSDTELHNMIFRAVHTVKGTSSFLGFDQLSTFAHHFEDLLNKIRRNEIAVSSTIIDVILESFDLMKGLLQNIEARNLEPVDVSSMLARLKDAPSGAAVSQPSPANSPMESKAKERPPTTDEQVVGEDALPQPAVFDPDMKELLESFLVETHEIVEALGRDLLRLEKEPINSELHNTICRAVHTIKGTSSFLGLEHMTTVAHHFEDLLNKVRRREIAISTPITDVMLQSFDVMKDLLGRIEAHDNAEVDVSLTLSNLASACTNTHIPENCVNPKIKTEENGKSVSPALSGSVQGQRESSSPVPPKSVSEQTIRVDVNRLDCLMNLVGELVLARNQLAQVASSMAEEYDGLKLTRTLNDASAQIDFITTELQMAVMKTRMVPVGKVFGKLPRLIRDLAKEIGKEIELKLFGEETDLDKSVIEELNDPLVHIIRNASDHGIESPEDRERAGKPRKGTVTVKAEHEGNNIVISIHDDGKGMDPEVLKRKAIEKGLITDTQAREMSRKEAFNLIFAPGFSTAAKVTNVSGRGVGMDVVRTNILKLKGIIEIESEVGQGTKLTLKLPLTLAIIQGLLARVESDVFAIPLESVLEVIRVQSKDISTIHGREVISLRDSVIPLARVADVFDIVKTHLEANWMYVVVVGVAEQRLGMVVDAMLGQKEIVVKSLGEYLGDVPGIAGSTILGDGRAIIIVDVMQFMKLSQDYAAANSRRDAWTKKPDKVNRA